MPVRLRMQRYGAKKRPYFRLVATDKRNARDGHFIEMLGTYDPLQEPPLVRMKSRRVEYWLDVGAQPTPTVLSLVRQMRRGDVVDLSEEGADEAARRQQAESRQKEQEELRAQITRDAKAAQEAAQAEAEAKAADKEDEAGESDQESSDDDQPEASADHEAKADGDQQDAADEQEDSDDDQQEDAADEEQEDTDDDQT